MMSGAHNIDRFDQQTPEIDLGEIHPASLLACTSGLQDLFDRCQKPVAVRKHHVVKFLSLVFRQFARFERLKIKLDRRDRRFQFVGYRVYECVVLLVSAYLAQQKDGV